MSFSKSARKVVKGITPVKIKGERRTSNEIDTTVVNTLHSAWTPKKGGVLNSQVLIFIYKISFRLSVIDHSINSPIGPLINLSYFLVFEQKVVQLR